MRKALLTKVGANLEQMLKRAEQVQVKLMDLMLIEREKAKDLTVREQEQMITELEQK